MIRINLLQKKPPKTGGGKSFIPLLTAVVVVAALGSGGYYFRSELKGEIRLIAATAKGILKKKSVTKHPTAAIPETSKEGVPAVVKERIVETPQPSRKAEERPQPKVDTDIAVKGSEPQKESQATLAIQELFRGKDVCLDVLVKVKGALVFPLVQINSVTVNYTGDYFIQGSSPASQNAKELLASLKKEFPHHSAQISVPKGTHRGALNFSIWGSASLIPEPERYSEDHSLTVAGFVSLDKAIQKKGAEIGLNFTGAEITRSPQSYVPKLEKRLWASGSYDQASEFFDYLRQTQPKQMRLSYAALTPSEMHGNVSIAVTLDFYMREGAIGM